MSVLLLGIIFKPGASSNASAYMADADNVLELLRIFRDAFPLYFREISMALLPIVAFFLFFQIFALRLPAVQMARMGVGLAYTFFGLVLFLTGVNVGFMPAGAYIGAHIGGL